MKADQLRDELLTLRFEMRRSLGLPGLLGVLMIGAAAIVLATIPGVQSQTKEIHDMQDSARTANAHRLVDRHGAAVDAVALDSLPALFPGFAQSADDIALIFAQARDSDAHEAGTFLQLGKRRHATIAHSAFQASHQLVSQCGERTFVRDAALDAFWDGLSPLRAFLCVAIGRSRLHRA